MNIYRLKFATITIVVAAMLSGCPSDVLNLIPGNQRIPSETANELIVRGASIGSVSPRHTPLPDDIAASRSTDNPDMIYAGSLSITILPNDTIKNNVITQQKS